MNQNVRDTGPVRPAAGGISSTILRVLGTAILASALLLLATVPLDWKNQTITGVIVICIAIVIDRRSSGQTSTIVLMLMSLFCTTRYFWWRVSQTFDFLSDNLSQTHPVDLFFVLLLLAAETYAVVILTLGYFQSFRPLRRRPVPLPEDLTSWPTVDVYIPTYNEPIEVVRTTALAALNMDWPKDRMHVYILDDGKRSEVHALAETCGAGYIARLNNTGAKAGNINNALRKTSGEYVAVFDSDHIPTRSFLQVTMGWFLRDDRLGMVQTPHHFYSPDPFERNLGTFRRVPSEGELFYGVIQNGNDFWNAAFFCGSCAVIRRAALDAVGGIATETVTEDSHTALRFQRLGWNTAYIDIAQAAGLATANLADHITQRIRWARGMIQILRIENPLFASGLSFSQRLCYFNSVIHFLHAGPRLIFLTAPLVYLLLGRSNLYGYVWAVLAYAFPHLVMATITNSRTQGDHRHSFWNEVFETVLAPYILLPTLLALINPRWGRFNVTPKTALVHKSYFDLRIALPFLILFGLNVAGMAMGIAQIASGADRQGTVAVNLIWTGLNILILGATLAVPWETRQLRADMRVDAQLPLKLLLPGGGQVDAVSLNLSTGGAAIQVDRPCELQPGDHASVFLSSGDGGFVLPVVIRRVKGLRLGMSFPLTTMAQHRALVRVIFGRADAWITWGEGRQRDRPLRSLSRLVFISLRGAVMIPKGLLSGPGSDSEAARPAPKRQPALPLVFLGLLACTLAPAHAAAATRSFEDVLDLPGLGQKQPVTLRGSSGGVNLSFGIPVNRFVEDVALELRLLSSHGYQPDSRLNITLNGVSVAAIPFAANRTGSISETDVNLPSDLVVTGNTLRIELAGACVPECRKTENWVRIETATDIRIKGSMLDLADDLGLLPAPFFDPWIHRPLRLPVVFAEPPESSTIEAAGVAASWAGILADDRTAHFPVTIGAIPPGNAILLAPNASSAAASLGLADAVGPTLAMRANPSDPDSKLLVIAGAGGQEMLAAAQALATGAYPRQGARATIAGLHLPPLAKPYDAPRWLDPARTTSLGEHLPPDQLRVYGSGALTFYFRLPPDLSFGQRYTVLLRLAYRVTGVPPGQAGFLHVTLNQSPVTSLRFEVTEDPLLERENIYLPVSALYPNNTLAIDFDFSENGHAEPSGRGPEASILPGSFIDLRGVPRFVQLPRLDLFAQAGFPFTRIADMSETAAILPAHPGADQLSMFLDMMGRFGGETGSPGTRITVLEPDRAEEAEHKDLLVLGSPDRQPLFSQWSGHLPLTIGAGQLHVNQPLGLWGLLAHVPFSASAREYRRLGDLLSGGELPDGVIEGLPSPLDSTRSAVLMATVGSGQTFQPLISAFGGDVNLAEVHGGISLLQAGRFYSFDLSRGTNSIGRLSWREIFNNWMAANFWLIAVLAVLCALPIARWLYRWSERRAEKRLRPRTHAFATAKERPAACGVAPPI